MQETLYTRAQVSKQLGVHRITLLRWGDKGLPRGRLVENTIVNGQAVPYGYVYTQEEFDTLHQHALVAMATDRERGKNAGKSERSIFIAHMADMRADIADNAARLDMLLKSLGLSYEPPAREVQDAD